MKGERRDVLGDKVEELGGNLVTQDLVGNGREFGFYAKCNGKPLEGVQWENAMQ